MYTSRVKTKSELNRSNIRLDGNQPCLLANKRTYARFFIIWDYLILLHISSYITWYIIFRNHIGNQPSVIIIETFLLLDKAWVNAIDHLMRILQGQNFVFERLLLNGAGLLVYNPALVNDKLSLTRFITSRVNWRHLRIYRLSFHFRNHPHKRNGKTRQPMKFKSLFIGQHRTNNFHK